MVLRRLIKVIVEVVGVRFVSLFRFLVGGVKFGKVDGSFLIIVILVLVLFMV